MLNGFASWFASFSLCVAHSVCASDEWSGALHAELHGKLIKKYFWAPKVVQDRPFGWFVELDVPSRKKIEDLFAKLSDSEKAIYSDLDLQCVRLLTNQFAIREWAHAHCENQVTLEGEIHEPDLLGRELRAFNFIPEIMNPEIIEEETALACLNLDDSWEPSPLNLNEEDVADESLVLPMSEPERLVAMTGKLHLQILNGNIEYGSIESGGYPIYCWILKLDPKSFEIACSTSVRASFHTPATIRSSKNCDEMQLTGQFDQEWLCNHVDQVVIVKGYLWHAHTGHHHTPVMLNTDPWFK